MASTQTTRFTTLFCYGTHLSRGIFGHAVDGHYFALKCHQENPKLPPPQLDECPQLNKETWPTATSDLSRVEIFMQPYLKIQTREFFLCFQYYLTSSLTWGSIVRFDWLESFQYPTVYVLFCIQWYKTSFNFGFRKISDKKLIICVYFAFYFTVALSPCILM